jgi:hypothetical protein
VGGPVRPPTLRPRAEGPACRGGEAGEPPQGGVRDRAERSEARRWGQGGRARGRRGPERGRRPSRRRQGCRGAGGAERPERRGRRGPWGWWWRRTGRGRAPDVSGFPPSSPPTAQSRPKGATKSREGGLEGGEVGWGPHRWGGRKGGERRGPPSPPPPRHAAAPNAPPWGAADNRRIVGVMTLPSTPKAGEAVGGRRDDENATASRCLISEAVRLRVMPCVTRYCSEC